MRAFQPGLALAVSADVADGDGDPGQSGERQRVADQLTASFERAAIQVYYSRRLLL